MMLLRIKKIFPKTYSFLLRLYHNSAIYKDKILKKKEKEKEIQKIEGLRNKEIIDKYFQGKKRVSNGPFKGMDYIENSFGSQYLPKILGSYEEPIHEWVEEICLNESITKILDIGCAEGYYACGFALRKPNATVIAYDIDIRARELCKTIKEKNHISNLLIKEVCDHSILVNECNRNTLVFCDIEGGELELLNPIQVPQLRESFLIVECHDFLNPIITDTLIKRFYKTHQIQINVDYPLRLKNYGINDMKDYEILVNELRPKMMNFIFFKPFN